jgi:hypothetical protein
LRALEAWYTGTCLGVAWHADAVLAADTTTAKAITAEATFP